MDLIQVSSKDQNTSLSLTLGRKEVEGGIEESQHGKYDCSNICTEDIETSVTTK